MALSMLWAAEELCPAFLNDSRLLTWETLPQDTRQEALQCTEELHELVEEDRS